MTSTVVFNVLYASAYGAAALVLRYLYRALRRAEQQVNAAIHQRAAAARKSDELILAMPEFEPAYQQLRNDIHNDQQKGDQA